MCRGNEGRPLIWKEINDSQNAQQDFTNQLGGGDFLRKSIKKKKKSLSDVFYRGRV